MDLVHVLGQDHHHHHTSSSPLLCIGIVSATTYRLHLQRAQGKRKRRPHKQNDLQSQLVSSGFYMIQALQLRCSRCNLMEQRGDPLQGVGETCEIHKQIPFCICTATLAPGLATQWVQVHIYINRLQLLRQYTCYLTGRQISIHSPSRVQTIVQGFGRIPLNEHTSIT